jgi:hypothetical protein
MREIVIAVRVNEVEQQAIQAAARAAHLPSATLGRLLLLQAADKHAGIRSAAAQTERTPDDEHEGKGLELVSKSADAEGAR